jgi:hypothetical protein
MKMLVVSFCFVTPTTFRRSLLPPSSGLKSPRRVTEFRRPPFTAANYIQYSLITALPNKKRRSYYVQVKSLKVTAHGTAQCVLNAECTIDTKFKGIERA